MSQPEIEITLTERGGTHGEFCFNSAISQLIKAAVRTGSKWAVMTPCQREALDMIAHKMGRICEGDPNFQDHWHDIEGYAKLAKDRIYKSTPVGLP